MNMLIFNLLLSTVIFYFAYQWLLKPRLPQLNPRFVLTPILLLHSFRHLGLMFLATGVVSPDMPWQFAVPAAIGDCLSASLAMLAAILIQRKSVLAIPMLWIFTIVGTLDFVMAIGLSRAFKAGDYLGAAYWIPAFWVPMLIVGHKVIFDVLRMIKRQEMSLS
jgi:hypothetical protein